MDILTREKKSPESVFHNKSVFKDIGLAARMPCNFSLNVSSTMLNLIPSPSDRLAIKPIAAFDTGFRSTIFRVSTRTRDFYASTLRAI